MVFHRAQVVIADSTAASDVSLTVTGTTPTDRSLSLHLDVLLLTELESAMTDDLERLAELLPGFVAEVCALIYIDEGRQCFVFM